MILNTQQRRDFWNSYRPGLKELCMFDIYKGLSISESGLTDCGSDSSIGGPNRVLINYFRNWQDRDYKQGKVAVKLDTDVTTRDTTVSIVFFKYNESFDCTVMQEDTLIVHKVKKGENPYRIIVLDIMELMKKGQ